MKSFQLTFSALLFALTLGGCANRPAPASEANATTAQAPEPWFCQPGIEPGQWECVRSEQLARTPQPTRAPVIAAQPTQTRPATAAPSETEQTPAASETTAEPSPESLASARQPAHVRLAYQPDQPVSLLDLPVDFWAAQLVALSSPEDLEQYAKENGMQGMSAARVLSGDELFYVLLLGVYETRSIAEQAITDLPPPFDTHRPWLRPVGSLQKAIRAADAFTGQ